MCCNKSIFATALITSTCLTTIKAWNLGAAENIALYEQFSQKFAQLLKQFKHIILDCITTSHDKTNSHCYLRCCGKNSTGLENTTVKEFCKSANICRSYERMYSGTVFFDSLCILYMFFFDSLCILYMWTNNQISTFRIELLLKSNIIPCQTC